MTIDEALRQATVLLQSSSDTARLDSECLLCHCLGVQRSHLYAWPQQALPEEQHKAFEKLLAQRLNGEPIAYIRGWQEFWSLKFVVGPGVLIPRPETELLVEQALNLTLSESAKVLDLGTGSGCIALSLAAERADWQITAVDQSADALTYAQTNLDQQGVRNVELLQSCWFTELKGRQFDVIVSNPPYVAAGDAHLDCGDVQFEPKSALLAGSQGLDDLRTIAGSAKDYLAPGGTLLLEHGFDQALSVASLLREQGYSTIRHFKDLQQHTRLSAAQKP